MSTTATRSCAAGTIARAEARGLAHVQLLDAAETADLLCMSVPTLRRYVKAAKVPQPIRIGSLIRWRLRDLERFLGLDRKRS